MRRAISLVGLFVALGLPAVAHAQSGEMSPFLPTWKLLRGDAKQQFVAGYLFGWRDAAKVTDVAIEYVQQNPNDAVQGLERVRRLYDMADLTSDMVVRELDRYFAETDNNNATLSQAITAARVRLGR